MATWVVNLDFQDGGGNRDISAKVIHKSFRRSRYIWKNLKPAQSACTFKMHRDATIINLLLSTTKDVLVSITKDASDYFYGIVKNTFTFDIRTKIGPTKLDCVDRGERLKKVIDSTFAWTGYKVCDPASTGSSILHQLLTTAGFSSGEWSLSTTINKTIAYFVNIAPEKKKYHDVIRELLFEFGYVFHFGADGKFAIYDMFPSSVSTTANLDDSANNNMIGRLSVKRRDTRHEGASIKWWDIVGSCFK